MPVFSRDVEPNPFELDPHLHSFVIIASVLGVIMSLTALVNANLPSYLAE